MPGKTEERFIRKFKPYVHKKWRYVLLEGVVKFGISGSIGFYLLNTLVFKYPHNPQTYILSFVQGAGIGFGLHYFLYHKFLNHYISITQNEETT